MTREATSSLRRVPWARYSAQAIAGLLVLAVSYSVLLGASITLISVSVFFLIFAGALFNVAWIIIVALVVGVGIRRRRPGLYWSPLIFCVLWLGASLSHRAFLSTTTPNDAISRSFPTASDLAGSSLRWDGSITREKQKLLAEGRVAAIVTGEQPRSGEQGWSVTAHRRGAACEGARTIDTTALRDAGRFDECFITEKVATEPKASPSGSKPTGRGVRSASCSRPETAGRQS